MEKRDKGGEIGMKEYITSFGVPIVSRIEGGTMEDLQKSISEKLSKMDVNQFPSLKKTMEAATEPQETKLD